MIQRMSFTGLMQGKFETVQAFVVRLQAAAHDCEFSCPAVNITYEGIFNDNLQMDTLAKARSFPKLDDAIKHCEAFEAA